MLIAGGRVLEGGARDAAQLARFLDEPRETFGTQVRIAERDQNGKVVGSRDAHVWHTLAVAAPRGAGAVRRAVGRDRRAVHLRDGVRRRGSAGAVPVGGGAARRVDGRV